MISVLRRLPFSRRAIDRSYYAGLAAIIKMRALYVEKEQPRASPPVLPHKMFSATDATLTRTFRSSHDARGTRLRADIERLLRDDLMRTRKYDGQAARPARRPQHGQRAADWPLERRALFNARLLPPPNYHYRQRPWSTRSSEARPSRARYTKAACSCSRQHFGADDFGISPAFGARVLLMMMLFT